MIKRIDQLKDFGIFKNFNWGTIPDIEEFKEKNILYGWNYSGKTTLSRIFTSLRDKEIHSGHKSGIIKLTCDSGVFDNATLPSFPYEVLVFNAEYVKDNLRWEFDEHIQAIYFEVGNNAKIAAEIERIEKLIDAINGTTTVKGKKERYQNAIDEFNNFEALFTQEAGRIKNDAFSSLIEFNKGHLKRIKDKILDDLEDFIIDSKEELAVLSKTIKIEEPKPQLKDVNIESNIKKIINSANEILQRVPSKENIIGILDKLLPAFTWVKSGVALHKESDSCLFCGSKIPDKRFAQLISYFENESSRLKDHISSLLNFISEEEKIIDQLNIPTSINDFNDGYQEGFKSRKQKIEKEIAKCKAQLKSISIALSKKATNKIYSPIDVSFSIEKFEQLFSEIKLLNELIKENNQFTENFEKIITADRDRYKNHLVAIFLKQSKFLIRQSQYEKALDKIESLDEQISAYSSEISRLIALKESDSEGCAQFNSFVQSFLSRDDIEIKLNTSTKKFNLMRGAELAQNLSEGEKMAIAFSHFLVNLKSIEQKSKLKDYIIYIDDPISSLDSNHIFQINSLLKETFFELVTDPAKPKNPYWKLKCKQLFISTHNFEFFTLLKELPKKGHKDSRYFIARKATESTIEKLPAVYSSFASEYHYLFGEILTFSNDANKNTSPKLLFIPNIIRRFLEMYTLTKLPTNDEVDTRAEKIFGKKDAKRILKLLHHFSHFNNIDRISKHSEFVADIGHACDDLIYLIKTKDKMHFDALEASVT